MKQVYGLWNWVRNTRYFNGLQAPAQEQGLGFRLDVAWRKIQKGLIGIKSLEKSRLGQYSVAKWHQETVFWWVFIEVAEEA